MPDTDTVSHARKFLRGEQLKFAEANELWKRLKEEDQLSLARQVLRQLREKPLCLSDGVPNDAPTKEILCRQEALVTSKDPELDAATRHDEALDLLANGFAFIENKKLAGDEETLGIAGGICKRRWNDLGQLKDLVQAAEFYERAAKNELGDDAYPHINAAFLEDLLAAAGDRPAERRERAKNLRERILRDLPVSATWFNAATRAEALFGLGKYAEATDALGRVGRDAKPAPWELRTMAEQLAQLAYLREERPLEHPPIHRFFETLLPGASDAIRSVIIGKVGLALSGGGFRASFYHLGVLACLAERDILRDVEVLSCVSGGSIVGACYWLKLRQRLLKPEPMRHESYVELVRELISHFQDAVRANLRGQVQPYVAEVIWRFLNDKRGALDPEKTADALEKYFYRPLWPDDGPIQMDQLVFSPTDHDAALTGSEEFNPGKHNWLRAHKVPALILNATTVNTGHAWRFTPTWMGESPWSIHESADSIPRLEWSMYDKSTGWQIRTRSRRGSLGLRPDGLRTIAHRPILRTRLRDSACRWRSARRPRLGVAACLGLQRGSRQRCLRPTQAGAGACPGSEGPEDVDLAICRYAHGTRAPGQFHGLGSSSSFRSASRFDIPPHESRARCRRYPPALFPGSIRPGTCASLALGRTQGLSAGSGGDADRSGCIHVRRSVRPDGMWLSNGVKRPRPRAAQAPEGVASSASRRLAVSGDARRDNIGCKHDGTSR